MLIARSDSIAANSRSANLVAGETFEFLPANALVSYRAAAAAAGLKIDFGIGGEMQIVNGTPPPTNRFPIAPDDTMTSFAGARGERLTLYATNTTGAAIVLQTVIEIIPQ